ncbi:DUF547 domain-containing protein [Caulobacter henricii]|uniref:DUF547 domain-containing protein n=1 Tax=Caulobacter henricii TaxID=69395 RepID=A0A0N7JH03_9CAUL|nr:DUF547 domain-containing protein [Caulobacter henricii]ALL12034.1 hypothetical protein AQ619_00910 [Caulobacter henricii]
MADLKRRGLIIAGAGLATGLIARPAAARDLAVFADGQAGRATVVHAAFDALLARWTHDANDGVVRVDYASWRRSNPDRDGLGRYIESLSAVDPRALNRPEQFAFWANLYNALTLREVIDAWPVRSIRDIRSSLLVAGPWKKTVARVRGVDLSLDDIEHGILRKGWSDPRVHYAVNCASFSCPNLPRKAWRGTGLGPTLDTAARAYVNHPRGVTFKGAALTVSSIYKWYSRDFGGSDPRIIGHLAAYAAAPLKARLLQVDRIAGDTYNWSINDMENR